MALSAVLMVGGMIWIGFVLFSTIFGIAEMFLAANGNPNINPLTFVWYGGLAIVVGAFLLWYSTWLWRK